VREGKRETDLCVRKVERVFTGDRWQVLICRLQMNERENDGSLEITATYRRRRGVSRLEEKEKVIRGQSSPRDATGLFVLFFIISQNPAPVRSRMWLSARIAGSAIAPIQTHQSEDFTAQESRMGLIGEESRRKY
jgi:hypothetical protein